MTPLGQRCANVLGQFGSRPKRCCPITRFDATNFKTQFACEVKDFDPSEWIHRKDSRKMDLFTQYAVVTAEMALKDAGLSVEAGNLDPDRAGVIWGSGIGGFQTFMNEAKNFYTGDGTPRFSPFFIPMMITDIAPGHISIRNNLRGPNYATVSACASSTHALIDAFNTIRLGKSDVVVTGGSEAAVVEGGIGGFNALKALSTRNDDPARASRPFDATRDGFVLGEGGGAIILGRPRARSCSRSQDLLRNGRWRHDRGRPPHHGTSPRRVWGAQCDEKRAWTTRDCPLRTSTTSTCTARPPRSGDVAEVKAIQQVFGEAAYNLNISSTKSMTGHLLGAAGAIEAMACIMSIVDQVVPPTINHEHEDDQLDNKLNFTLNKAQKREVRAALSNTFGFGGHNASVVFKALS